LQHIDDHQGQIRLISIRISMSSGKETTMNTLTVLILLGMAATVLSLIGGVGSMAHGGKFDDRHSHQFMFARVGFQGVTLVLLLIALVVSAQ